MLFKNIFFFSVTQNEKKKKCDTKILDFYSYVQIRSLTGYYTRLPVIKLLNTKQYNYSLSDYYMCAKIYYLKLSTFF